MAQAKVYILNYNGAVQFASKDVKALWGVICKMAQSINLPLPHSYVQVTRTLNESGTYIHSPGHNHAWDIITRELLMSRRSGKKKFIENAREELTQVINK